MLERDALLQVALQFVRLTNEMLVEAEQGHWELFLDLHDLREQSMAIMMKEAGDALLEQLPALRAPLQQAREQCLRIDDLASARRDELGENLASAQHTRRLRAAYRS